ncbi:hypothetical protein FIBSPDRAFT_1040387 [Athelia psychrophila]|uniref:C2 domain-containing protein n=1 Tax=Athelia psychrophila TaxID=1759441 RepID=A0A166QKM0_9AGAM|nr:hypothetical protein FIBSPDRAFT_1040387 [Fibularhizoctonia sp. CBS 109695]
MSPESEPPLVAYTLQIISANDLPLRRLKVFGERNVTAKATVEGSSVTTKVCTCTSSAEWNETFQIEAHKGSSVLSLRLTGSTHGTSLNCVSDITISDLLQLCRNGKDAEVDLHDKKSGRKLNGRIKIHLSLTRSGDWILDEAQRWALVLSHQPDTALTAAGRYIDDADGLLAKAVASESISNVLDKLSHFMGIADELAKIHPYAKGAWDILSAVHKVWRIIVRCYC